MRQITKDSVNAFKNRIPFYRQNMEVVVRDYITVLKLFGNDIAYLTLKNELVITNAGYKTVTTKERLNGVLSIFKTNSHIHQSKGEWYLDGKKWNGTNTEIKWS